MTRLMASIYFNVVLYTLIQFVERAATVPLCSTQQYAHNGSCCDLCGPGSYVVKHCNKTSSTVCSLCEDGTFSPQKSSLTSCIECKKCAPTMVQTGRCNSTADTKCECTKDHYIDFSTGSCRACKVCPQGSYAITPCTPKTICATCKSNHFLSNGQCTKCSVCKVYKLACESSHDAVCGNTLAFEEFETKTWTEQIPVKKGLGDAKDDSSSVQSHVKYIIITGIIVIVSIPFLLFLLWWRRKKVSCHDKYSFKTIERQCSINDVTFNFGDMLFRDVSGEVILKLESLLNPGSINNWKRLGVELQLSQTLLKNFNSTSEMLSHWQTSNDATTQKLYAALKHIGRDDACKYLEENATSSCRETNVQI
ncbi:tumor necrosis factor receptor superfamily member 9-like isoform X2 [Xenia sp. Carnegie-2017]|uniref:tumor necrosis factor receptor superfamily member 9-like isoform X2 n=1 Tax=Xenia sp. Carnegie-2017 TaxID=2897299 RepID=UPI001F0457B1|nr:tumor necrosis factor receptor superfamily member 9-like isoform X2 [Xenia sp. Carnegie-2017]